MLASLVFLLAVSLLTLPHGTANAAGDRKGKTRAEPGRAGSKGQFQGARRGRDGRAAPGQGHRGAPILAPNERQNLRQSVYDATRDLYKGS